MGKGFLSEGYMPAIEPCLIDLSGGRSVLLTPPAKGFPDVVDLLYDDGQGGKQPLKGFKICAPAASRTLEREFQIGPGEYRQITTQFLEWTAAMAERELTEDEPKQEASTPAYGLRQRTILQKREEALEYAELNSSRGFVSVLQKPGLPADTLLEWGSKDRQATDQLRYLACLDLDFHDPSSPERLTDLDLDRLGYALSPKPFVWWRSQGGGLHAMYASTPGSLFTAEELAVGAAAQLLTATCVLRAKGTVEIKATTRHPGAEQKGKRCGRIILGASDTSFAVLARFSQSEATEDEATEMMEKYGYELGQRLDHAHCRIDPQHVSTGTPVHVGVNGLYCHSCMGRLGKGLQTWGFLRKLAGLDTASMRSLAPIREAFENLVHVKHVDYLFAELFPTLPEDLRRILYRAQLKKTHEEKPDKLPLIEKAFETFYFVRGMGQWLHADTLLPVGKALAPADVAVLPSCVRYGLDEGGEGTFSQVPAAISAHINNGRIPGWIPIQSYGFEPIFFVHNDAADDSRFVRCRPLVRTTRERVSYVAPDERMPLAEAEAVISAYFPGISMLYLRALIIATGCAESGNGPIPILWVTGPTESAKTTTISIALEMYGETFQNLSGMPEERLNQVVGDALHQSRILTFDDFAKQPSEFSRLHTFLLRLNRSGYTHYQNYVGGETEPFNSAVVLTDWRIPSFFTVELQFGRRVHLLRLDNRLPVSWSKLGHQVERWWKRSLELTKAANAFHSWVVDEFFGSGDSESFDAKMLRLGIPKLEEESNTGDTQEAVKELVVQLIVALSEMPAAPPDVQRRVGRSARFIDWDSTSDKVGAACKLLIDSLGKPASGARSRGRHDDRTFYTPDNLRHVLDPFQLHLPKMYTFKEGVAAVEFEIRSWGEASYIRLAESGRAKRSKTRAINEELFDAWPPVPRVPMAERPAEAVPGIEIGTPVAEVAGVVLAPFANVTGETTSEDDGLGPWVVHLDFESQSACDIKKRGSYIYAQHPSTKVMCAALIAKRGTVLRKIFWTPEQRALKMPPGIEYEYGVDFLHAMVTDPVGCIIVPHNVGFERAIWEFLLKLPQPLAWRDTMDKALACGYPGGADEAGMALLKMGKDEEGQKFIRTIWGPNKKGMLPVLMDWHIQKIINYNFRDTEIGFGITEKLGLDMTPAWEQRVCDLHHKINHWGIYIDQDFSQKMRAFDSEFKSMAGDRVELITGGHIKRTDLSRNDFLRAALNQQLPLQYQLTNMRQTTLEDLIDAYDEGVDDIDADVVEVIRCRLMVTRAAVAKVDKALDSISADGRAKAQLRYWGAGPGRFSGYGIQPHNMKRPNEDFDLVAAITAIETEDREAFVALCKDVKGNTLPVYELLGSLTRGILAPAPGNTFVVGDFASIEARGLLWLAGDMAGLEEYRRKDEADERHPDGKDPTVPDTYQTLAGDSIFGKDPVTVSKKERGGGKIGILACLAEGTPVLTDSGWKAIEQVNVSDKVWDGVEWVNHEGLEFRGVKQCQEVDGVWMTNDHNVLTSSGWISAGDLLQSEKLLQSARALGSSSLQVINVAPPHGESLPTRKPAKVITANTYDLKNAGPRNRFQAGGLIVHNCGFGGGAGAVERMALPLGVDLAAIGKTPQDIVDAFRTKYGKVKAFWYACDDAFRQVLTSRRTSTCTVNKIIFEKHPDCVRIIMPSGRPITYMNARLEKDEKSFHPSGTSIVYDKALRKKVVAARTHGARIAQNITEGFCRDLLCDVMLRCDDAGAPIAFHVHDEVILEVAAPESEAWRERLQTIMRATPAWAVGMPIFSKPEIMRNHYGK